MVFPSPPSYPHNSWNQPKQAADDNNPPRSIKPGPTRPGSMAERARLAKIAQPESPLSCPRCDSTNTKFCYYNNYSLSQPRHFCKACRRYWTRGGALRNVPVGGGCRRNKRSGKSSSLTATSSPKITSPQPLSMLAAVTWNQLQEYGFSGTGWRLPYFGGMEAAAPTVYGYHEGEWGVGGSINGNGGEGWMSNSSNNHVLGFGSLMQNGNI